MCAVRVKRGQNVVEVAVVECRDEGDDDDHDDDGAGLGSRRRRDVLAAGGSVRSG